MLLGSYNKILKKIFFKITGFSPSFINYRTFTFYGLVCIATIPVFQHFHFLSFLVFCIPLHQKRFRLFPFSSPLIRKSRLLSLPSATKMFQFTELSTTHCIVKRLPHSGIFGSSPVSCSPKHIVSYYALLRL